MPRIAVLIPCYNEEKTIGSVVSAFRAALPGAEICVGDNNSTDRTAEIARAAGARVLAERRQGKGNVVRRMFADVDADVFVLVDGDDTYDAFAAPVMVDLLARNGLDMVNGARQSSSAAAFRPGHVFGNRMLTGLVRRIFDPQFSDMLSGYKVMSRRFVKTFPALSSGFETETELTVHALELRVPCAEVPTAYRERPEGSASKLHTVRDGTKILMLVGRLIKHERPFLFFGVVALAGALASIVIGAPVVVQFFETGLVPKLPSAVLSASLMIIAALSFTAGVILETVTRVGREAKRLAYLSVAPRATGTDAAATSQTTVRRLSR
jgi:glycosyltransferase involved in cell wall biosynthesis